MRCQSIVRAWVWSICRSYSVPRPSHVSVSWYIRFSIPYAVNRQPCEQNQLVGIRTGCSLGAVTFGKPDVDWRSRLGIGESAQARLAVYSVAWFWGHSFFLLLSEFDIDLIRDEQDCKCGMNPCLSLRWPFPVFGHSPGPGCSFPGDSWWMLVIR